MLLFPLARFCRARGKSFFIYTSLLHVAEGGDAPSRIIRSLHELYITRIIAFFLKSRAENVMNCTKSRAQNVIIVVKSRAENVIMHC